MMSVQEKQAWYQLAAIVFALISYLLYFFFLGVMPVLLAFSFFALVGIASGIGDKKRREGKVLKDERDRAISKSATLAGYRFFWIYFAAACMIPLLVKGEQGTIPVIVLPWMLIGGAILIHMTRSLVVIALYRRGSNGGTE